MTIQKLDDFAENGDKNLTGIDIQEGFVQAEKPARQWFNYIFNSITNKVNEVITAINNLVVGTDKIEDGAVTITKLAPDFEITGDKIAKDADLDTPKLTTTYAITTLDAPNLTLASDGTLNRSNDPLNAASRKVGTAQGNLVERDADGYPSNNNAIGVGQAWQDVKTIRTLNTIYTNTTGRPIILFINGYASSGSWVFEVGGLNITMFNGNAHTFFNFVIPSGATYTVGKASGGAFLLQQWVELR